MKFYVVDPRNARAEIVDEPDWTVAALKVGVIAGRTDHALVYRDERKGTGIGLFCYEFGLYVPTDKQSYFSVGTLLIAGAAVFYAFNEMGETCDLEMIPPIVFYRDAHEVEKTIRAGAINRPEMKVNDVLIWKWPDRVTDEEMIARMREHGTL